VVGERRDAPQRLLVLGAGPAQLGLLKAARGRGLHVIACDRDPAAVGFRYADRRALVSAEDAEGVERLARAESVGGIIAPGIDWPVAIAARVAATLGLPHPIDPATAAGAVSKLRQRTRFDEEGVPQPRWQLLDPGRSALEIGPPCVVKPPDRQGQRGLSLVETGRDLEPALRRAEEASRTGGVLVEELVDGPEVTVNAFSVEGDFHPLTATDRLTADPPAFGVALAHAWPAAAGDGAAIEVARCAVEALGIREGPSYTQVRLGPEGPKVMEVAARLGGGHDAELCHAALGIDLNSLAIDAALGTRPEVPLPLPVGGACVRFLVAPEGHLVAVEGLAEALGEAGVVDAGVYRAPGWSFGPLRSGADRAGFVIARGESRHDALARAVVAGDRIRFVTVDAAARLRS
jgi:biotin carboxylase